MVGFDDPYERLTTSDGMVVWPQHQQMILHRYRSFTTDDRGPSARPGTLIWSIRSSDHDEGGLDHGASETSSYLGHRFTHATPAVSIEIGMPRSEAGVAVIHERTDRHLAQIPQTRPVYPWGPPR